MIKKVIKSGKIAINKTALCIIWSCFDSIRLIVRNIGTTAKPKF